MTVADLREKSKKLLSRLPPGPTVFIVVVGAAIISFTLGYLAGVDRGRVGECALAAHPTWATTTPVVASRAGTVYYFLSCAGAGRISSNNRILFPSPEAAESTGYTLATSCRP